MRPLAQRPGPGDRPTISAFETPNSLDRVLVLKRDHPEAVAWGGGTDLMLAVNARRLRPELGVGLRRVAELRTSERHRIGSGVTLSDLVTSPHRALAQAARTVGSPQIRHAATLGGNLGTASPAGDTLPVLAAYGAQVVVRSHAGRRTLRWDEFLLGPRLTALRSDEVIESVLVPEDVPRRQAFGKVGARNAMAISRVSVCVTRSEDGTTRVALGAVGPVPLRADAAEALASTERRPTAATLAEFARLVSLAVRPITDHRATEEYRRHAAGVLAKRQLMRCCED